MPELECCLSGAPRNCSTMQRHITMTEFNFPGLAAILLVVIAMPSFAQRSYALARKHARNRGAGR